MRSLMLLLIEPAMYFGVGFLLAGLAALPLLGVAHRRAERLTKQRMNTLLPTSIKELQAEKDLLRAEFAVSAHRLGGALDALRAKTTAQQVEIGRQGRTLATLKTKLGEQTETISALEARKAALEQQLRATEQEHSLKSINLEDARQALIDKEAELARLVADAPNATLAGRREEMAPARRDVADERSSAEDLGRRVAELELELIAQRKAAVALSKVTAERFCENARLLSVLEHEIDRLRTALDAAQRAEAGLRYELTQVEERRANESQATLTEQATLEVQIAQLQLDRQQLQWELAAMRRDARAASNNSVNGTSVNRSLNGSSTNGRTWPSDLPFRAPDDIEIFMRELRTDDGTLSPNPAAG